MIEDPGAESRQVIDLTRESDVAYWCRIFDVTIEELREAVKHAGHEPSEVRRHLSNRGGAETPGR